VGSTKGNRLTRVEGPAVCSRIGSGSDDSVGSASLGRNRPLASTSFLRVLLANRHLAAQGDVLIGTLEHDNMYPS
jgi:hypothetical protein